MDPTTILLGGLILFAVILGITNMSYVVFIVRKNKLLKRKLFEKHREILLLKRLLRGEKKR